MSWRASSSAPKQRTIFRSELLHCKNTPAGGGPSRSAPARRGDRVKGPFAGRIIFKPPNEKGGALKAPPVATTIPKGERGTVVIWMKTGGASGRRRGAAHLHRGCPGRKWASRIRVKMRRWQGGGRHRRISHRQPQGGGGGGASSWTFRVRSLRRPQGGGAAASSAGRGRRRPAEKLTCRRPLPARSRRSRSGAGRGRAVHGRSAPTIR